MISIELVLDAATDSLVRRDWRSLVDAGLPSAGRHTGESNRPHVTLAARAAPRSLALEFAASALPIEVAFGGLLLFPGPAERYVLARSVIATSALLAVHRAVAEAVGPADDRRYANTEPDHWTPHVTLARRMPVAALPAALEAVSVEPISGFAVGMRVWDAETKTVTEVGRA